MALSKWINKAKAYAQQNPDKAKQAIDKIGTTVDKQTGGKYRDKINKASDSVGGALGVDKQPGQVDGQQQAPKQDGGQQPKQDGGQQPPQQGSGSTPPGQ
ncbi:antitoxin [Demetria terragena]|uniref:antitoxin n=1 Tax=Demetria terragena TaxID=63959 RepID=UPI00036A009E|nr:antitoxin [Demetria terragena]